MARKSDATVYLAIAAIPIASFAAFALYRFVMCNMEGFACPQFNGPAPDMKGYIFDANTMSCETCGR